MGPNTTGAGDYLLPQTEKGPSAIRLWPLAVSPLSTNSQVKELREIRAEVGRAVKSQRAILRAGEQVLVGKGPPWAVSKLLPREVRAIPGPRPLLQKRHIGRLEADRGQPGHGVGVGRREGQDGSYSLVSEGLRSWGQASAEVADKDP